LDRIRLGGGLRPAIVVIAVKIDQKITFDLLYFAAPQPTTDGMYFCEYNINVSK